MITVGKKSGTNTSDIIEREPDIEYIDRKFNWDNLFWSCGHCNGVKNQRKYDEHIVDCCKSDPEVRIHFRLSDGKMDVVPVDDADYDAEMTAELVKEVTFGLKKLQALIRKESRFAAFKRCYIRENQAKYRDYL